MSIGRMDAVLCHSRATGNDRLILLVIADAADADGYCWPGMSHIAERANCAERTALRAIERLEASGELLVVERGRGRGHSNRYIVTLGMSDEEIAATLRKRHNMSDEEIAEVLDQRRKGDSVSPFVEREKVTDATVKGDRRAQKVTDATVKGDTGVSLPVIEPSVEPSNEPTAARSDGKDERPTASRPTVQEPSAPSPTSARVNEARARRAREEEAWRDALSGMQRDCEGDEERFGVWSLATGKRAKALAKAHKKSPDELLTLWRAIVETAHKPVAYLNSIANAGTWQPPAAPRRPTKKLAFWVDGERVIREVPA